MASLDFAAKVRWRTQHDRNPLLPQLQDKLAVKAYAAQRGVASPAVLFHTDQPATIPFDMLPPSCFIKANHGCGWNYLCENGEYYFYKFGNALVSDDGSPLKQAERKHLRISREQVIADCNTLLNLRYWEGEWAYQHIVPRILIEEKLYPAQGHALFDYRFYTFDGVVRAINVGSASFRRRNENVFLTPDWQAITLTAYKEALPDPLPARPEKLGQMIAAAQRLGAGIDFVRVDLYQSTRGVMLGEMTIYPEAGRPNTPTACPRFNRWLGDFWQIQK